MILVAVILTLDASSRRGHLHLSSSHLMSGTKLGQVR